MIRQRLLLSLLGALFAATVGLDCAELPEDATYTCAADSDCPTGQRCLPSGLCAAGDTGPSSRDAGRGDGGVEAADAEAAGPDAELPEGPDAEVPLPGRDAAGLLRDASAAGPDAGGGRPDAGKPVDGGCPESTFACQDTCCPLVGSISAWGDTTCAVDTLGDLYCWGDLSERRHGPDVTAVQLVAHDGGLHTATPVKVYGNVVEVAVGPAICARRRDEQVVCWGNSEEPTGKLILRAAGATAVGKGRAHGCAATHDAGVVCWGAGNGPEAWSKPGLRGAARLALGDQHSCALVEGGSAAAVYCWGNPAVAPYDAGAGEPCRVTADDWRTFAVASGPEHACAAGYNGSTAQLTCWGSSTADDEGVLAYGGNVPAADIASAKTHNCIATPGGRVSCWGKAPYEAVGVTTEPAAYNAQTVCTEARAANAPCPAGTELEGVAAVAAGARHSCARRVDGKIYCWGENRVGQLGVTGVDTSAGAKLAVDLGP